MIFFLVVPLIFFTLCVLCLPMAKTDFDKQISDQEQEHFLANYKSNRGL